MTRSRRQFLQATAITGSLGFVKAETPKVTSFVLSDASDPVVAGAPVQWAISQFRSRLAARGLPSTLQSNLEGLNEATTRILVTPGSSEIARRALSEARVTLPARLESLGIVSATLRDPPVLMLTGTDTRGLVYSILELADRIQYEDAAKVFTGTHRIVEQPANEIRSVQRLFVSDLEDTSWYNDKSFWTEYLSELATQRFAASV